MRVSQQRQRMLPAPLAMTDCGFGTLAVLLPFRNVERWLEEALASVAAQTWPKFRVILIDDGSVDRSRQIAESFCAGDERFILVDSHGVGLPGALNLGLDLVNERYVARMDGDDICLASRFETQLRFLAQHPEVVAVGCHVALIDEAGWPLGRGFDKSRSHIDIVDALLCRRRSVTGLCHPTLMMRTEVVKGIGGYRQVAMGEDIDLLLRLAVHGELACIPEVLFQYRLHLRSLTANRSEEDRCASQSVRIEAYRRMGIPLPENLEGLKPPPPLERAQAYRRWSRMAARHGFRRTARKYAVRLLALRPLNTDTWKTLLRAIIGYPGS